MSFFIIGLVSGIVLSLLFILAFSNNILLKENISKYNFEESLSRLEKAIESEGWKLPAKHDLRQTLLKFGKADVKQVVVLEICNPDLSEKILLADKERSVSSLMPCRISLYEKEDGKVYFSRMNAGLLSGLMKRVSRKQMGFAAAQTEKILDSIR